MISTMDSHYNRKHGIATPKNTRYNGSLYTMTGSGAQVLMNTHTIVTATAMQFLPPVRTKATMCSSAPSTCNYGIESTETKTESYPLFNAIKGFFTSFLRPIISSATTLQYIPITTETNGSYATSNAKFHEAKTNVYMNVMPADIETSTFFDCDDYVDSEDTVDFIAGTTPKFEEFVYGPVDASSDLSPKTSAYFDCVSTFGEKEIDKCEKADALVEIVKSDTVTAEQTKQPIIEAIAVKKCSSAQQKQQHQQPPNENCGLDSSKQCIVDKPHSRYRSSNHARNRRRPHSRSAKSLVANKNRNEKHRQELAQIIHDDIECIHESASDFEVDDEEGIDSR